MQGLTRIFHALQASLYRAFRSAAVGMRPQALIWPERDAAGVPAGSKWYALFSEMRRSQRVAGSIDRNLPQRQGTNASKQMGLIIFMTCSG